MLDRLLDLIVHAKAGTISGVLLVSMTGALVTATTQSGVTTITFTQETPSPSPSASASPSVSPTPTSTSSASPSPSPSPSPSASPSPSSSPSSSPTPGNGCEQQARAAADAVHRVDRAFEQYKGALEHLRDRDDKRVRDTVAAADTLLKQIRQAAVKAIHDANTCAKRHEDDEDGDEDDDDGGHHAASPSPSASPTPTPTATPAATPTASPASGGLSFSGDPKTIADQAIDAMKLVFDTAKAAIGPEPTRTPRATHRPDGTRKSEHHGD